MMFLSKVPLLVGRAIGNVTNFSRLRVCLRCLCLRHLPFACVGWSNNDPHVIGRRTQHNVSACATHTVCLDGVRPHLPHQEGSGEPHEQRQVWDAKGAQQPTPTHLNQRTTMERAHTRASVGESEGERGRTWSGSPPTASPFDL